MPDFKGIKTYLHQALDYATDPAAMATANIRANTIELLVLLYKAQAAAGQATLAGLESAVDYLEEATMLDIDATQLTLVEEKIKAVNKMKAELAALQAAEAAAAEAEAAEEKAAEEAAAIEEANQAAAEESQLANEKNAVLANAPQVAAEEAAHTE
jgi:16S rRNA G966 N2-methylase RsmD